MTTRPAAPETTATPEGGYLDSVYILSVSYSNNDTDIKGVYDTLELAQDFYRPNSLNPAKPWTQVRINGEPVDTWRSTFASGNYGALVTIRKMTVQRTLP